MQGFVQAIMSQHWFKGRQRLKKKQEQKTCSLNIQIYIVTNGDVSWKSGHIPNVSLVTYKIDTYNRIRRNLKTWLAQYIHTHIHVLLWPSHCIISLPFDIAYLSIHIWAWFEVVVLIFKTLKGHLHLLPLLGIQKL